MDSKHLQRFIDKHNVDAIILPLDEPTPTVSDAARALGVVTDQIIKSLLFKIDGEPLLVINNGLARVDRRKLAACLGVNRKKVKLVTPQEALDISGYVVGSMPPFGHKTKLRTLADSAIQSQKTIYGGGGEINAMLQLTPTELIRVANADTAEISE